MQSLSLLLTCCWTQHAALVSGRVCIADLLIQAEGRRRSASPAGQAAPGVLAAAEEAGPADAQPEEAVPAAEQPAEAMPADASSADTAAGVSAQDQPSASSSSGPKSVSDEIYDKAVKWRHLAASIDAADPLHNQEAAASWKGNMLELVKLTCQLALCAGPDFPSQPDDIEPMELAKTLAMFCEVNFYNTSTSIPAPEVAAAPGIAYASIPPASISAVRSVSSGSSDSSDSGAFRSASFKDGLLGYGQQVVALVPEWMPLLHNQLQVGLPMPAPSCHAFCKPCAPACITHHLADACPQPCSGASCFSPSQ